MDNNCKYVVIDELTSTGFIECVAICENRFEALGKALDTLNSATEYGVKYYITPIKTTEGDSGECMSLVNRETGLTFETVTILRYKEGHVVKKREE